MVTLLSSLFIKNSHEYENPMVRKAYGFLTGVLGICLNIVLFVGKYLVGVISGSISITADALNNLSDAGSSVITLIGFQLAGKKPDPDHPFGHGRIEYISGLGVSLLIMLMGVELLKSSVNKILHPEEMEVSIVIIAVLVASILVKVYMSVYNRSVGKKINSAAMRATATDSLSDCIATSVVLISMIIYHFTGVNLDGWSGVVVAVFILFAGFSAMKDTLSPLLGEAPDEDFVKAVEKTVRAHELVTGIHDMVVHDYGPGRLMISLHAEVPGNKDIYQIHDEIDIIEGELKDKFNCDAVIHMDPVAVDNEKVVSLRQEVNSLVKAYDDIITIHDFRMVEGPTHTNLIFDAVVPYNYKCSDEQVIKDISGLISEKWSNYFSVIKVDKKYTK